MDTATIPLLLLVADTIGAILLFFSFKTVLGILMILILLLCASLLSAAEVSFFSLSPTDLKYLEEAESKSSKHILKQLANPKQLLATLLITHNLVIVGVVILSSYVITEYIDKALHPNLVFFLEVIGVTCVILIIAEILPKIYASQRPLKLAKALAFPIAALSNVYKYTGLSALLIQSTSIINNKIRQKGYELSVDELSHALELTSKEEVKAEDRKILKGIVKFGNIEVRQIMKSRMDVDAIEHNTPFLQVLHKIEESGHSRIPIYKESFDNISGILYIKDLLPHLDAASNFEWQKFLHAPFFVPERKKLDDLLKEFQSKKMHLAIVVDEYGGTSGIVTLEDVIEEIVGEINDEFDDHEIVYSKLDNNNFVFEGKTPLNDFCKIAGIDSEVFESIKGDSHTLAGLILELKGEIPQKNDVIQYSHFTFKIESADKRKIKRVKITIKRDA